MDRQDGEGLSLFTPGPVDISAAAGRALAGGVMHHRSEDFRQVLTDLQAHLRAVFMTDGPVATLTSSGTGAMEAAVANLFSPGERVLVPVSGKFSARWADICRSHRIETRVMELGAGESPDAEAVVCNLSADGRIDGVLLTHCETSTGSLTDVESVCRAVYDLGRRQGRRFATCVDCVTSLCIDEFRMDEWHVDCATGASQKGFLCPPGLAFVAAGPAAMERLARARGPRYYFDLRRYFDDTARSPFTPAVQLVSAARESIGSILELGLPVLWRAYKASARAIRLMVAAGGFRPVAVSQAGGVVAFWLDGLDAGRLAAAMREGHGIIVAHGQGDLRGRIVRVSTIGKGPAGIRRFGRAIASVLADMGRSLRFEEIEPDLERILEDSAVWESLR